MPLGREAVFLFSRILWKRWQRLTVEPRKTQEKFLLRLLRVNQNTAFGRDHRFNEIRTITDYQKRVSVSDYERFRPYIKRASLGEAAMLTREPILMFNMTSGSASEPKLIPVTETTHRIHKKLTQLWYSRAFLDHPRCFEGKVLGLVSPAIEGFTPGGIPYGSASGLIYRSSPWWIKRAHALPYEISEIKNFGAKYYVAMRLALEQNVTFLGTPNPTTILRLVDTADRHRDDIIKDIHDGTLSPRFDIADSIRTTLLGRISANAACAKKLEALIRTQGRLRPADYWPELQLIGCWKGGSVGIRIGEFATWFDGETPVRDLGYLASEAHMSLPISDTDSAGILAIDANFYEFIPEAEIDSATPNTLSCYELEVGGVYYLILTTAGGLYRYDINDLIRVTDFFHRTPVIEFLRKGRDVTSLTGEKLHVNQVIQAINEAQRSIGLQVRHYRAVADAEGSRYRFLLEFDDPGPSMDQLRALLINLDQHLHQLNVEYAQKRQSWRLAPPLLHLMKRGGFERSDQMSLRQGTRDTQFKTRLLTDRFEDENEILLTVESKDGDT